MRHLGTIQGLAEASTRHQVAHPAEMYRSNHIKYTDITLHSWLCDFYLALPILMRLECFPCCCQQRSRYRFCIFRRSRHCKAKTLTNCRRLGKAMCDGENARHTKTKELEDGNHVYYPLWSKRKQEILSSV